MMQSPFPENYEQWQHCITVECGIPLTAEFVSKRLAVWKDNNSQETKRFRKLYGDDYLQAVIGWFERAEQELGGDTR
ncbi:MAG: hypothetical protein AAF387_01755 [Pseudomonadota bacterium]